MKKLVLLMLLVGCGDNCPSMKYRDYQYQDEVTKIYSGFYKGHTGTIIGREYRYVKGESGDVCQLPGFVIDLDGSYKDVWIDQFKLYVGE